MSQNQNGKWKDHKSKSYEDLQLEFNPLVFSSLEQYLPHHMLSLSREVKVHYMWSILLHYLPETERIRVMENPSSLAMKPNHCARTWSHTLDFTSSGRYVAVSGRKGHLGIVDMINLSLIREF
ncbi:putative PKHD-type hydroxylase [Glycine soja]